MLSGAQLRAARALLGWSQEELAARSGTSNKTIARAEAVAEPGDGRAVQALVRVLEENGIVFTEESNRSGVSLQK